MSYRINKTTPTSQEKQKQRRILIKIMAVFLLVTVGLGYGFYYVFIGPPNDQYAYWKNLIEKDPKPEGVSEAEYREKNRAGYCWRDRKFYRPEELQEKAVVSFSGRLLEEVRAYRTNETTNQGGRVYTSKDCKQNKMACRVWFIPSGNTNKQWDKLFLAEEKPEELRPLSIYKVKEIQNERDLQAYLKEYSGKGFTLDKRNYAGGTSLFGSDCCVVMTKEKMKLSTEEHQLITHHEGAQVLPENRIPENIEVEDYGVGNFYLAVKKIVPGLHQAELKEKTYQTRYRHIFLMNNCGDILWQPYYYGI